MAKAVINLQKESGGIVKISPVDGIGITEVTVPESGELATVDYVKNNGDINSVTSFSQISGTNEIVGIEYTNNIHDIFGDGSAVATYNFDGNANDLGGNCNGTWTGTPTYSEGKFGNAATFNGSNYLTSNSSYNSTMSVSLWLKTTNNIANHHIAFNIGNGTQFMMLDIRSDKNYFCISDANNSYSRQASSSQSQLVDGNYHHIVITLNNSSFTVYIDGNIVNLTPANAFGSWTKTNSNSFGGSIGVNFNGSIDQVRIFNRVLAQAEIDLLSTEIRVSEDTKLNINQGTFIYPKGLTHRGYAKSSDTFTGTVPTSGVSDGWKYVAKDESNNFSFYTNKPTIGKKSSTLYLENGSLYKTVDDTPVTPISFLSNKVRIKSGVPVELAPSDISKTVSESLEADSYFGRNTVVAYATINMATTPPTILDSYNVASVVRSSNGVGKITLVNSVDKNDITAICGSNSVAGTITSTTKSEINFATGSTNYAKTSIIVIGGKF